MPRFPNRCYLRSLRSSHLTAREVAQAAGEEPKQPCRVQGVAVANVDRIHQSSVLSIGVLNQMQTALQHVLRGVRPWFAAAVDELGCSNAEIVRKRLRELRYLGLG